MSDSLRVSKEEKSFQSQPRFSIMYLLFLKRRIGFTELSQLLTLTPGNLGHHIRMLEDVGLVRSRRVMSWKPLVIIEITAPGVEAFRKYISKLKELLENIPDKQLRDEETDEATDGDM